MAQRPETASIGRDGRWHILIRLTAEVGFDRGVTRGVLRFAGLHHRWRLYGQPAYAVDRVPNLRTWRGDGVIGRILDRDVPLPEGHLVNVSTRNPPPGIPTVGNDDRAIGRLAAQHLAQLGLSHFAFFGDDQYCFSRDRLRGFTEGLRDAGKTRDVTMLEFDEEASHARQRQNLVAQLASLPRPMGIMALTDTYGWNLLEALGEAEIAVPEEAAVLGVDNDEFVCEMAEPSLSSIKVASQAIGFRGAEVLDDLFEGRPAPETPIRIPPIGVISRRSTDMVAVDDVLVAQALRFIRGQPPRDLSLDRIFGAVPASRRVLERRFRAVLNRTVWQEVHRYRLSHAQRLLAETRFDLERIAEMSGFANAKQLGAAFRNELKTSPTAYRRRWQSPSEGSPGTT
ncbi:MAG: DNA-binding transcriptional regulator [Phycisphaeraceae bacterium]|nr:DNA-binding transcriptional regulator [Phycisphaeraceae bacterium]